MTLRDVTGVFSRFFVVGFFVPSFFTLFVLWLALSTALFPDSLEREGSQTQLLVLGGASLFIGLVLLGLRFPTLQFFEGYKLRSPFRPLWSLLVTLQERSYDRYKDNIWALDRRFPKKRDRLLPTRFGNAMLASEDYAYDRYGLDTIAIWPRIHPLLSEQERELHANAQTDVHFFLNGALGALATGGVLLADQVIAPRFNGPALAVYAIPFVVSYVLYRFAIGAAERWGTEKRATSTSIDSNSTNALVSGTP